MRIHDAMGVHDVLLTMVKKRKLRWYGHISTQSEDNPERDSNKSKKVEKTEEEMGRQHQRMGCRFHRASEDRKRMNGIVATLPVVPRRPSWLRD